MPLLRSIKKQLSQFVKIEEEPIDLRQASLSLYKNLPEQTSEPASRDFSLNHAPVDFSPKRASVDFSPKAALEQIYKLEQVDVKSIRKLSVPEPVLFEKSSERIVSCKRAKEIDLGIVPEGKNSIDSFILEEPVLVLGFSQHVEKLLAKMNISLLQDLLNIDFTTLVHVKGMGQGHIEEIKEKLDKYIAGRVLKGCQQIDFEAWVKSLMPLTDKKRTYLVLDLFDLSHLISLSPPESVEIRRLSPENKSDWLEEGKEAFNTYDRRHLFNERFKEVIEVFLKPWMLKRGGFVKKEELFERFDRLSLKKDTFLKTYTFFKEIFFEGQCPIARLMLNKGPLLFANRHTANSFDRVHESIDSYFYNNTVSYPLQQLVRLVEKEFSMKWIGFPEGFVEKVIRSSCALNVIRGLSSLVVIKNGY